MPLIEPKYFKKIVRKMYKDIKIGKTILDLDD
jgi:hypothetical protein